MLVEPFAREHGLTSALQQAVVDRGMSRSDALGIASFLAKYDKARLPGSGLFRRIIERATDALAEPSCRHDVGNAGRLGVTLRLRRRPRSHRPDAA